MRSVLSDLSPSLTSLKFNAWRINRAPQAFLSALLSPFVREALSHYSAPGIPAVFCAEPWVVVQKKYHGNWACIAVGVDIIRGRGLTLKRHGPHTYPPPYHLKYIT